MLGLIIFFVIQIFCGWTVLSTFKIKERFSLFESMALAYGMGMGFISLEIFFLFLFKLPLDPVLVLLPWVIFAAINLWRKQFLIPDGKFIFTLSSLTRFETFLLCAISFEIFYSFFRAAVMPMDAYDSLAIWGLKAKAIYLEQALPISLFKNPEYSFMHMDYPLMIPLEEAFFYKLSNGINDGLVKVMFSAYFLSLLVVFASGLYRLLGRRNALLFTFLLSSMSQFNNFSQNGYVDLVVAFYYSLSALFIYHGYKNQEWNFFALAAVFSGMGAWAKNEGMALYFLNLLLLLVLGAFKKKRLLAFYLIMGFLFIAPWFWFRNVLGLTGDLFTEGAVLPIVLSNLNRILKISVYYQIQFFDIKRWNIMWGLFLLTIIFNFRRLLIPKFQPVFLSLVGVFGIYTVIYILTPLPLEWQLSTTVSRIFIHFAPLAVFWLALVYDEVYKKWLN
ncbi:MAG: glycosyltransferase family 39 protein [Candidatus Omnitrophota bacterium]